MSRMIIHLVNLRALAMIAGMIVHCILFLVPADFYPWLVKDFTPAPWASVIVLYIYMFQTGIFFSLAGYFGKYAYQKLGTWKFLQERIVKVGFPFLFGMFIPILIYLPHAISIYFNNPAMAFKFLFNHFNFTGILWFLYYLLLFYLMMVLGGNSILNYFSPKLTRFFSKSSSMLSRAILLLSSFIFMIMLVAQVALILPSLTLMPHWDFLYYFLFFCCGWLGYKSLFVLRLVTANNCWLLLLTTGIIFPVLSFLLLVVWPYHQSVGLRIIINLLEAFNAVFMLLGIYSVSYRYLNRYNYLLDFSAQASYWCYYAQYPVIIILQAYLLPMALPAIIKAFYVFVGTLSILLLSYWFWKNRSMAFAKDMLTPWKQGATLQAK